MKTPGVTSLTAAPPRDENADIRKLSHQMEGVFLNQLFQAMRETVPQNGLLGSSAGEDLFTSLMDQNLADRAAERLQHGLGDALYHQLTRRLPQGGDPPPR